jgi:hypothetical protein
VNARTALAGRREEALLALPSVRHMVDVIGRRCRDASWVRTSVASLDRFATLTECEDLEDLISAARNEAGVASRALSTFASALGSATPAQFAALAIGPTLWFTFNGVPLEWRTRVHGAAPPRLLGNASDAERLVLLALIGTGLRKTELLRLTIGDVGALDARGALIPDVQADPLAVRFEQVRGRRSFVTFFSAAGRAALHADLRRRSAGGEVLSAASPLIARAGGTGGAASLELARARRFNTALIAAGNNVNVDLCVATGRFFRAWGPPGARFTGPEQHA